MTLQRKSFPVGSLRKHAPVAQGTEHSFPKAGVAGSIPAGGANATRGYNMSCADTLL